MADDEDCVRLTEKSVDNAVISQHHLPLKKRRKLAQPETPDHPNSASEIAKNKTPEIDVHVKRPDVANGLQERSNIKKLVLNLKGVKKTACSQVDESAYLNQLEWEARRRPLPDYIEKVQKEFTVDMRSIFVDWLVKIAEKNELPSDIMHLTVSCIDRYLSVKAIDRQRLKLLGVSSLLISLKYEYLGHSCEKDLYKTTGTEFTKLEVAKMGNEILKSLEFEIGNSTVKTFLRKFTRVAQEEPKVYKVQMEFLCDYLADLSLLEYKCLKFSPSLVAASVVFLSRCTIRPNSHPWSSAFQQESGYEPANLKECVLLIHDWQTRRKGGGILNAVRNKYKNHEYKYVSELPSPETIPDFFFGDIMGDEEVWLHLVSQMTAKAMGSLQQPPIKKLVIKSKTPKPPQPPMFMSEGVKKVAKKISGVDIFYLHQFPSHIRRFVTKIMNVPADGHCGFRAIADLLGLGVDSHGKIRGGLFRELVCNLELYRVVFLARDRVEKVLHVLNYFKEPAPKQHWFCLPDIGYLVASHYNVALVCLEPQMSLTFLPLRTPIPKEPKLICIGFINGDHFVKVNLLEGCPLPPVADVWYTERDGCTKGWLKFYNDRLEQQFKYVSKLSSPETIPDFFFGDTKSMGDEEVSVHLASQMAAKAMGSLQEPPIKKLVIKLKTPKPSQPLMFMSEGVRKVAEKTSGVDIFYLHQFPSHLRRFVTEIMNVPADGHCGFRAIADLLGFGVDSHGKIRGGLFRELVCNIELYRAVFLARDQVEKVLHILNYFKEPAPKEHWFCLPDIGYLVASHYNVALVCLEPQIPSTFLPLRTPIPKEPKLICIGCINGDHFVKVNLLEGCPLPPVANIWYTEREDCTKGWLAFYNERLKHKFTP